MSDKNIRDLNWDFVLKGRERRRVGSNDGIDDAAIRNDRIGATKKSTNFAEQVWGGNASIPPYDRTSVLLAKKGRETGIVIRNSDGQQQGTARENKAIGESSKRANDSATKS